jgi:hypothetical protein
MDAFGVGEQLVAAIDERCTAGGSVVTVTCGDWVCATASG